MSKIEVDQVDPQSGTNLTLGTSGDSILIPSGVTLANSGTMTGVPAPTSGVAASAIDSGTIATARLGSGTASSSTFLRGDSTFAAAGGGKVGQVISTQLAVLQTTTATSYEDITGVAVTITPSATSSKVLVQGSILWGRSTNNTMWLKMFRDSTNINGQSFSSADTGTFWASGVDSGYYELRSAPFSFLDSPNTTNAVTYKIQWRSDGNTLYMNRIGADTNQAGTSQINAIEILA